MPQEEQWYISAVWMSLFQLLHPGEPLVAVGAGEVDGLVPVHVYLLSVLFVLTPTTSPVARVRW